MKTRGGKTRWPDLYTLIRQLQVVDARVEDNTPYQISNDKDLGILFASFVSGVKSGYSPSILKNKRGSVSPQVISEFKKRFEKSARAYLGTTKQELALRQYTTENLEVEGLPTEFSERFSPNTVESLVANLAEDGRFGDIGKAVTAGARSYHDTCLSEGRPRHLIRREYDAIENKLKEVSSER